MKKIIGIFLGCIFFLPTLQSQNELRDTTLILLKNAFIIDGIEDKAQKGDILIKNEQIDQVVYGASIPPPKGAIIYDLSDKYIIPGLIDAHVHFGTDPSGSDNLEDTKKRLNYLLKNGITSVRDMAGDTRFLGYLARAAALKEIATPDIYYSALMAGHTFFDDPRTHASARGAEPGNCPWMKAVDLQTDMKLVIAAAKGTSASGIKVYADLDAAVIQKIVQEAHLQGLKVWSHAAVFPAKPQAIVEAGVNVISHSTLLAWEGVDYLPSSAKGRYIKQDNFDIDNPVFNKLMTTMQQKGTILDATLATYQHERFDSTIFLQGVTLTRLAYKNGVKIGVGTDMSVSDFPKITPLLKEMDILVKQVEMTPIEVIKSATIINAEMMSMEQFIGTIEVEKRADLVVLNKNPLADIQHLQTIKYVFKRGVQTK